MANLLKILARFVFWFFGFFKLDFDYCQPKRRRPGFLEPKETKQTKKTINTSNAKNIHHQIYRRGK